MKEFALHFASEHPWLTFFLVDSAIAGTVKIIQSITGIFSKTEIHQEVRTNTPCEVTTEEEPDDEPTGDID